MNRFLSILILAGLIILILQDVVVAESCSATSCHSDSILNFPQMHAPVKDQDCQACHQRRKAAHPIFNDKSWDLIDKVPQLCFGCHNKFTKKMVHSPVKEGDCLACHKPHGGTGRFLLNVSEGRTELCLGCHDSEPFKQPYMHGPVAVGSCNKCHEPHESPEKALLAMPVRNVCLKCHADFSKHLKEAAITHPPVKEGPCTACHDPHGSTVSNKFLKKKVPDLCVGCHAKIGKKLASVKVPHKPLRQAGGCSSCHSAHYSENRKLLPHKEMDTCLSCHGKDNLGTPPLRNIKRDIDGKKYLHGPIKKGECTPCHDPHGSDNFRMLRGKYPAELYIPYKDGDYGACLTCHEKNLLRFAETTIYTKFRNGRRNLHYVHVVNSRKSRSCRICHQPHAADGPLLINKESVKFGEWDIPINLTMSPTGGRCLPGCHQAFNYDRDKPVIYRNYSTQKKIRQ